MRKQPIGIIGPGKQLRRFLKNLSHSLSASGIGMTPVAIVVTDDSLLTETALPTYDDWGTMLKNHDLKMIFSFESDPSLKKELRTGLPPEIDLVENETSQIVHSLLLNQRAFMRKAKTHQQYLESFIEALPLAAIIFDNLGHIMAWNDACSKMTGVAKENVIGHTDVGNAFYDRERPLLGQVILKTVSVRSIQKYYDGPDLEIIPIPQGIQMIGYLYVKDNIQGYYQVIAQRIMSDGEIIGSVQLIQDLSSLHILQEQLSKQQEQLKAIISHLPFPLVHTDLDGRVFFANKSAQQAFPVFNNKDRPFQDASRNILTAFPELGKEFRQSFLSEIMSTPPEFTPHLSKTQNLLLGDQEWGVTCLGLPEQGKTWTLIWIFYNISQQEEQERLNAAVAIAGAISHELSQPLTAIINSAQLLANTSLDDRGRIKRHVNIIAKEGERVLSLYQKLHNISKYKLTKYLDMQIFDLEKSADLSLTINPENEE